MVIKCLKGAAFGILCGASSPIPGISGGTLFVFFNIYEEFFRSANFANLKKNLPLFFSFLIGCTAGLVGISHIIMHLLIYFEKFIYFSFIGLILGCIPMIYRKATVTKIKRSNIIVFIAALSFMLLLAFTGGELNANATIEQLGGITPLLITWVFFTSFISSIAILIPGVGGSIMMLAFGIYTIYIEAIATLNPIILPVFVISMALGIIFGIKITQKLLVSRPQTLYGAILGFIIGSIFIVFPGFMLNIEGLLSLACMVVFAVIAYKFSGKKPNEPNEEKEEEVH